MSTAKDWSCSFSTRNLLSLAVNALFSTVLSTWPPNPTMHARDVIISEPIHVADLLASVCDILPSNTAITVGLRRRSAGKQGPCPLCSSEQFMNTDCNRYSTTLRRKRRQGVLSVPELNSSFKKKSWIQTRPERYYRWSKVRYLASANKWMPSNKPGQICIGIA